MVVVQSQTVEILWKQWKLMMSQTLEILVGECSLYWNSLVQSSSPFFVGTPFPNLFF